MYWYYNDFKLCEQGFIKRNDPSIKILMSYRDTYAEE